MLLLAVERRNRDAVAAMMLTVVSIRGLGGRMMVARPQLIPSE